MSLPPSYPLLLLRTHSSFAAIYIPFPHSHTRGRSPDPACAAAINSAAARVQRGIRQRADSSERQATASGSLSGQRREEDRSHTLAHETLTAHSQGFNFCDGAPLTGGERLELCYFPAVGGDRYVAGGDGETEPIDPCFEANFVRIRWQLGARCSPLPLSSRLRAIATVPRRTPTSPSRAADAPTSAGATASTTASSRRRALPSTSRRRTPPSAFTTSTTRAARWSWKGPSSPRRAQQCGEAHRLDRPSDEPLGHQ